MLWSVLSVTVTSRKWVEVEEMSLVNLIVGWMLLRLSIKSVSLSCPCVQIKKNIVNEAPTDIGFE